MIKTEWELGMKTSTTRGFVKPLGHCFHPLHYWTAWPFYALGRFPANPAAFSDLPLSIQTRNILEQAISITQTHACLAHIPPSSPSPDTKKRSTPQKAISPDSTSYYYVYLLDNRAKQYVVTDTWQVLLTDFDGWNEVPNGERFGSDKECYKKANCFMVQPTDRTPETNKCIRPGRDLGRCYGGDQSAQVYVLANALLKGLLPLFNNSAAKKKFEAVVDKCLVPRLTERPTAAAVVKELVQLQGALN
eukprot:TRINITY_DN67172_c3_g1_i4.p1 TRINITY_DN67172_c3_g1~~TRINITY_DN67172_c3_g1_i4.p1  ORF type:complete len:247 (+),score=16.42 TRINITY_DN67172_c3_g1_i4:659-1399(+)